MTVPLLSVDGLTVELARSGHAILRDVGFDVAPGVVTGIVGESGSGKSLLALTVMGLLPSALRRRAGAIRLDGTDLTRLSPEVWRERRGRDLAMIFQEPMTALNPVMRVGNQVLEVLRRRRGLATDAARAAAVELFRRVELPAPEARLAAYPHELSGGMRQRVMIAIALAAAPRLLVADEPTTALDVTVQAQILDLLRQLRRADGLTMLFITHDLGVIADIADCVMVLYAGAVVETAPVRRIFDAPGHPYTQALLASMPKPGHTRSRLMAIDGAVPPAWAMPPGCRFAPRCADRRPVCDQAPPPLRLLADGQQVACLKPFGYEPAGAHP